MLGLEPFTTTSVENSPYKRNPQGVRHEAKIPLGRSLILSTIAIVVLMAGARTILAQAEFSTSIRISLLQPTIRTPQGSSHLT